jgi:transcriptional regulator with XRE-family HTH domain
MYGHADTTRRALPRHRRRRYTCGMPRDTSRRTIVGPHVRQMMAAAGVTQKAAAERLDVKPSEIAERLSGRTEMTVRELSVIADQCGASLADAIPAGVEPSMPRLTLGHVLALSVLLGMRPVDLIQRIAGTHAPAPSLAS